MIKGKKPNIQGPVFILFAIVIMTMGINSTWAQSGNPLDQFRTNNNAQPESNVNVAPPFSPSDQVPAPTVGGFQQQGLNQNQINSALQDYDFDGGLSIEEQQALLRERARDAAFEATLNGAFPLTPDEILELLDRFREVREASESRIGGAPTPEITLQTVSLDPGSQPPVIKLSPGHVTTMSILDVTGEPWPIQDISWGGNFEVIQPQEGENIIRISPMKAHEVGNLSVRLLELNTPVIFSLQTNLDEVQYRFDAQIPEYGPGAKIPLIDNGPTITSATAGNQDILGILDGTPPAGIEKLDVEGVDARTTAYDLNGVTYVRTPLTLLSPGWNNSIKSADGTTVYAISRSPVLLLSERGKMVRATIDYN